MAIYRNIEGLASYQNAVHCMNALNTISGVEANIIAGGLGLRFEGDLMPQDVLSIVKTFGGCVTTGLTEMEERIIYPYPTK